MKNLKKEFPVTAQYTHLNTAGSGLMSESVLDFRQSHDLDYLILGSLLKDKQGAFIDKVREEVGAFFNCEPQHVGLVPNFSYGFNCLLEGLPKTNKILLLQDDYPSINWPVTARGFEVCYAAIDENLEQNILAVLEQEKPQVLALSLVQYVNGIQIDFNFLQQLKERFPELIIVADGTQYCGVDAFNFATSGIDILGASAYKWMNAGYGNGFFLFKDWVKEKIFPKNRGYGTTQGKYKDREDNLIGALEPGHLDTLNFGSLKTAIDLIKNIGLKGIESHVTSLKQKAFEAFAERGLLEATVLKRTMHAAIFNIKGNDKMFNKLREKDIICSQRGAGIRVSFHYYNTEDDLEVLLKAIK